jgi:carbonic anhydrase
MKTALEVFACLREGNNRFVAGLAGGGAPIGPARRTELATGQDPFAVILGCSDSRVPAEIIFDQGLGDLFVIRVAGHIVAPSQIGSVEFAVERFGIHLVVVLGHSGCGAVTATLEELRRPSKARSPNLAAIVNRIRPTIAPLLKEDDPSNPEPLLDRAVRANIRASVDGLGEGSPILRDLLDRKRLLIVGAEYSLKTGVVEFLDEAGRH